MAGSFSPFEEIFALQRALDARHESDWFGSSTAGTGAFPPINIFQKECDFVAIVELPGVDKVNLEIEAKESTIRISGVRKLALNNPPAFIAASALTVPSIEHSPCRYRSIPML